MNVRSSLAALAATGILAMGAPALPAAANGAASTRNLLLLGGAAAAYLIIRHNHKVHEERAEHAARQAAEAQRRNDAWSAYHQAQSAYSQEAAANAELQKEVAYQHSLVVSQRKVLASLSVQDSGDGMVSYGWGTV